MAVWTAKNNGKNDVSYCFRISHGWVGSEFYLNGFSLVCEFRCDTKDTFCPKVFSQMSHLGINGFLIALLTNSANKLT